MAGLPTGFAQGIVRVVGFVAGWMNTLPGALYKATADVRSEGSVGPLQAGVNGELGIMNMRIPPYQDDSNFLVATAERLTKVATYSPMMDTSALAEASSVVFDSPCNLYGFTATNSSAGARYFQVFNLVAVPGDGVVPVLSYYCASGGTISDVFNRPRWMSTGCCWAWSTTAATKTTSGGNDGIADVRYFG